MSKTPLPRSIAKILNLHLNTMPAVVLSGARQTGKSTLAKDIGQDKRKFYSLDDISVLDMAQNDPKSLISESGLITLDEIQREPKLLLAVKHDIDLNRQSGRFLLTGSANLLLMQKVSESLAGRASYLNLWPLTRREQLGQGSCGIWEQLIGNDERTWIDVIAADKTDMEDWRSFARRGGFPVPAIHQTTVEERQIGSMVTCKPILSVIFSNCQLYRLYLIFNDWFERYVFAWVDFQIKRISRTILQFLNRQFIDT